MNDGYEEIKERILYINSMLKDLDWDRVPDDMKQQIYEKCLAIRKTIENLIGENKK